MKLNINRPQRTIRVEDAIPGHLYDSENGILFCFTPCPDQCVDEKMTKGFVRLNDMRGYEGRLAPFGIVLLPSHVLSDLGPATISNV